MRVLLLTSEYPPKRTGNISDHVSTLAHELVNRHHEVEIVALDDWRNGFQDVCGVHVHRVGNPVKTHPMASVVSYALTASVRIEAESSNIVYFYKQNGQNIDVVHAHEWFTVYPAIALKHAFDLPFVLTFHSIENHRSRDLCNPVSLAIKEIEDMGIWESRGVIVNSDWMKREILRCYGHGHDSKIEVVWPIGDDWVEKVASIYSKVLERK